MSEARATPDTFDRVAANQTGGYQVWHDAGWPERAVLNARFGVETPFPQGFIHVADVEAASLHQAVSLTTSDTDPDNPAGWMPRLWIENEGVQPQVRHSLLRDTTAGDVIVDPQGRPHRYDGRGFSEVEATAKPSLPSPGEPAESMAYDSPPKSIELARQMMSEIKEALTKDADGHFPALYAEMDWDGMNMQPPETAWQDMDVYQRYDLLRHALDEAIWSLEPSPTWDKPAIARSSPWSSSRKMHGRQCRVSGRIPTTP